MLEPTDLVRVAKLIKLAAQTARAFSDTTANGHVSQITDAADRIEAASDELAAIGREMESSAKEAE